MNPEAAVIPTDLTVNSFEYRDLPGQSALFGRFLDSDSGENDRFWPNKDVSLADFAKIVLAGYKTDRNVLCNALQIENEGYGAGQLTFENIDRLRNADSVAVITGQQAGLLSGPAYTVYKALTAIKVAAQLCDEGINAVPVFWIASEDHDFDEISTVSFRKSDHMLTEARVSLIEEFTGFPVGNTPIGPDIDEVLDRFFKESKSTQFSPALYDSAASAYSESTDFSTAFGSLLTSWLGRYGLVFTNPLNPVIRSLSAPVFSRAVSEIENVRNNLLDAGSELEKSGYHTQVAVDESYFPLFRISDEGKRVALREEGGVVSAKDDSWSVSIKDAAGMVAEKPEEFSPNALFRPVVQDFVFPTVCYIGGAAEIAYFAQNAAIYEALGRPVTPIRHRAAVTVLEPRHRRTLDAYDLKISDLWSGRNAVLDDVISKAADSEKQREMAGTEAKVKEQLDSLERVFAEIDPGLSDNFAKRRKKMLWHLQAMEGKYLLFEKRRNGDLVRRINDLFDTGFPADAPQERTITFADLYNLYGPVLLDWLYKHIDESGRTHRVLSF